MHGVPVGLDGDRGLDVFVVVRRVDVLRWLVLERGPLLFLRRQHLLNRRCRDSVHGVLDHRRGLHDLGRNWLYLKRCLRGTRNHLLRPG